MKTDSYSFKIYTEAGHEEHDYYRFNAIGEVSKHFDCFTVHNTEGYYKGGKEDSIIIEICSMEDVTEKVKVACKNIAIANNQECVMYTIDKISFNIV